MPNISCSELATLAWETTWIGMLFPGGIELFPRLKVFGFLAEGRCLRIGATACKTSDPVDAINGNSLGRRMRQEGCFSF